MSSQEYTQQLAPPPVPQEPEARVPDLPVASGSEVHPPPPPLNQINLYAPLSKGGALLQCSHAGGRCEERSLALHPLSPSRARFLPLCFVSLPFSILLFYFTVVVLRLAFLLLLVVAHAPCAGTRSGVRALHGPGRRTPALRSDGVSGVAAAPAAAACLRTCATGSTLVAVDRRGFPSLRPSLISLIF